MSQGPSTSAGGGDEKASQRTGAPMFFVRGGGQYSANQDMEKILGVVQVEVHAGMAQAHAPSSPSRSGCGIIPMWCLGRSRSFPASSSAARRSSARTTAGRGQASSSNLAITSASAVEPPAKTEDVQEDMTEQPAQTPTRTDFGAMMRSALAKLQVDAKVGSSEMQAPFDEMEHAITGLMELIHGKSKPQNPPELPHEFATKWPHDDTFPLESRLMEDPIILASGHSVDRPYHQWSSSKNICPVTMMSMSHSAAYPNDLLRDMMAAWCLDHSVHLSSRTAKTIPLARLEDQTEDILTKLQDQALHSIFKEKALQQIQLLSKMTKGEQPCLGKWPMLIPLLIDLQKNWKSTWTQNMEELRLTIILNLSVHRLNKEILAGVTQLPDTLKNIADYQHKLDYPASTSAKVASIVANLSEFGEFRKRILDLGIMQILYDLLKLEDVIVRKEAFTATWVLCRDEEGKSQAQSCHVPELLVERLTITYESLVLLDCMPKDPYVMDKLSEKVEELVNAIMADQATEPVNPKVIYPAISLVYDIARWDVSKMEAVRNLEDFTNRLQELSSGALPLETMFKVEKLLNILLKIHL